MDSGEDLVQRALLLIAALLVALLPLPAFAARLALVIGNDNYAGIAKLQKAGNDARAIGKTLESLDFAVTIAVDTTRREMNRAIQDFVNAIQPGDTAMFFYAGHGVEIEGENYLLPVDTPDAAGGQAEFISAESIALDDLLGRMRSREARINVIVLDACRNNPFSGKGKRGLGGAQGLARISAPQGTFVLYSADVGEAALDTLGEGDENPNSVFTRTLVPLMKKPGLDLVDTAREVRRQVRELAIGINHDQTPAYYDAVLGDFFFAAVPQGEPGELQEPGQKIEKTVVPAKRQSSERAAGSMIITGGEKDSVRLWDGEKAALISELEGEKILISTLAFIDGGRAVAIAGKDGALFSYVLPQFKKLNAVYPGFRVSSVGELKDGTLVVGGDDGSLAALAPDSWETLWQERPHTATISPVLVGDASQTIVTASADGTIIVSNALNGKIISRAQTIAGKSITDIAFITPTTIVASHEDGTIAYVNLKTGKPLSSFRGNKGWISSVDLSPEGTSIVTAGVDGTIATFALGSDAAIAKIAGHTDVASGANFMAIGGEQHMVSSGFDGALKIWNRDGSKPIATLDHESAILHFDTIDGF